MDKYFRGGLTMKTLEKQPPIVLVGKRALERDKEIVRKNFIEQIKSEKKETEKQFVNNNVPRGSTTNHQ
jgi:hypothetical protein